jgi:type III secretion protein S
MNDQILISYTLHALMLVLMLSLPAVLVAAVVGITVSLVQAVTQIQDQTLSFAVKLIAVTITIVLSASWLGGEIYNFALILFETFPEITR